MPAYCTLFSYVESSAREKTQHEPSFTFLEELMSSCWPTCKKFTVHRIFIKDAILVGTQLDTRYKSVRYSASSQRIPAIEIRPFDSLFYHNPRRCNWHERLKNMKKGAFRSVIRIRVLSKVWRYCSLEFSNKRSSFLPHPCL